MKDFDKINWNNKEEVLAAVKQDDLALKNIPVDKRDKEICLEAVKQYGGDLEYVPEDIIDKEICLAAVKKLGGALVFVPEDIIDKEICLAPVKQNGMALEYVPDELISGDEKSIYRKFLLGYTDLDTLLKYTNLAKDFKHNVVLIFAEHKMRNEFNKFCDEQGIKDDDEISKDLEDTIKENMAETAAKIDLKAENDKKKLIEKVNNIKL